MWMCSAKWTNLLLDWTSSHGEFQPSSQREFFCSDNKGSNVSRQLLEIIFLVSLYKKIVKMEIIC